MHLPGSAPGPETDRLDLLDALRGFALLGILLANVLAWSGWLMVDDAGKPSSCHVHWPTLSDSLNKKVCDTLMGKARFTPAKGPDAQPTAGLWIGSPLFLGPPMPGGRPGG